MVQMRDICLAFTTRIPLAVMIAMGIKQWENRAAMPSPPCGQCAMTCSKSSDAREYANVLAWAERVFKPKVCAALPRWEQVAGWRGLLAVDPVRMFAGCPRHRRCAPAQSMVEGFRRKSSTLMLRTPVSSYQLFPTSFRTMTLRKESPVREKGFSSFRRFSSVSSE